VIASGPVLIDIQGTQSLDHRDRGVARYVLELALALDQVAPERIGAYLVNPDLALPGNLDRLVATGKLRHADEVRWPPGAVLHIASPFELSVPLRRLLPAPAARGEVPVVVTLYDLIPEVLAEAYLADPGLRRRYRARQQLVRSADAILALSESTAGDAVERLGVNPGRVTVVGAAPAPQFVPPASREQAAAQAAAVVPGLRPPFVLYTGGTDDRKNLERLLLAWARVPADVRERWQLAIVCHLRPLERNHLEVRGRELGLGDGLALCGYVADDVLVRLCQGADLLVFPSLYEGYGLPIAEAQACGTPAVASATSALPELVHPHGRFDPTDPDDMAATVTRALTDEETRAALLAHAARPPDSWADVARRTVEAYDHLASRLAGHNGARRPGPRGHGGRLRVAFASPLPPQPSGVADYSYLLLEELAGRAEIHAFVDGPPDGQRDHRLAQAPDGVASVRPLSSLEQVEALCGPFDAVVYSLGNSEYHTGSLAALRRRPGVVLAHDVRLTDLYGFGPHQHAGSVPGGFHAALQSMYAGRIPPDLGVSGWIGQAEADRWGILMAREVVALSERFLASSPLAAELAHLDAAPADRDKIAVLGLAIGVHALSGPRPPASGPPVVATFGLVNPLKQTGKVVEAFAAMVATGSEARLVVVGPCGEAEAATLRNRAAELGVAERVELTGWVGEEEYRRWLERATVAVQLRSASNGETSGAAGACLASGLATVVTAVGPARDLPDDAVAKVPPDVVPAELGRVLLGLLSDAPRREALGREAAAYAAGRSFARVAGSLYELLVPSG
jgi:glycosyltransferase involved in cell wall biosynthesis